ncbi:EF-P lysine aminoacylase GenX [Litorivicinus lipolyticus]|uniref:EF-P lysine aminoacylase GenX n=1 Tax=Litorivicinus lipolyticus TaxID=418701 RepID=A0A5Q2QBH1_9GAMM|nr:EF-P lysine aminoacylase EpmA [Litorivicinus lipolyticus]QGG79356.1 EF-P lysine aminoacylase GenX [Litorivicinus lipolyticus]
MSLDLSARLRLRADTFTTAREFFAGRGLIAIDPPCLMPAPVTDPSIEVPRAVGPDGQHLGYLQSSPEYALKRLLAAGAGDCYALTPAFRVDEHGPRHRLEFTLLEWYRLGWNDAQLRAEVSDLMGVLLGCGTATEIRYRDAFMAATGLCPLHAPLHALRARVAERFDYQGSPLSRDDALQMLCALEVEPGLGATAPEFLIDYPPGQAALARTRLDAQGDRVAARFELFYRGLELANGYWELTCADEQRARFEADLAERQALGLPAVPVDQALLDAMPGLPDCAGVALGMDRVMLLKAGRKDLAEIALF